MGLMVVCAVRALSLIFMPTWYQNLCTETQPSAAGFHPLGSQHRGPQPDF